MYDFYKVLEVENSYSTINWDAEDLTVRPVYHQTYIFLNKDTQNYFRSVYTLFDMLGDIGGLLQFFEMFGQFLVWLLSGQQLSQFIIRSVFKFEGEKKDEDNAD